MSTNSIEIIPDENIHLLNELQSLLKKQIELSHQGNSASEQIESLSMQTDCLVEKIVQAEIFQCPELKHQRALLKKLYENLCLAISAQKAEVAEKIRQVRKGRSTIGTYRRSI
jgi:hypothetical protein